MKVSHKPVRLIMGLLFTALLTGADQITKLWAASCLKKRPILLIRDVLSLHYVENRGIGFGLFQNRIPVILILNMVILILILWILYRLPNEKRMNPLKITLLVTVAGALGNMIDRIRLGYVIDFISFDLIHFPVFNGADILVTCSVVVLAILYLFYYKNGELEDALFSRKRKDSKKSVPEK